MTGWLAAWLDRLAKRRAGDVAAPAVRGERVRARAPRRGVRRGEGAAPGLGLQGVVALDARRRLSLVQVGERRVLLLTGGGHDQVVGWLPEA